MGSAVYSFNSGELISASKRTAELYEQYAARLGQLEDNMSGLFDYAWVGGAKDAFRVVWNDWHDKATDISGVILQMSEDLHQYTMETKNLVEDVTDAIDDGFSGIIRW